MKYICSARLKNIREPKNFINHLAELLQLAPEQVQEIAHLKPFVDEEHVEASKCFRTWFPALAILREKGFINRKLNDDFIIEDFSVRFTRFESEVFVFLLIKKTNEAPTTLAEYIEERDKNLQQTLFDTFEGELDFDFFVTSKIVEYKELLRIEPITPLYGKGEAIPEELAKAFLKKTKGQGYTRYSRLVYSSAFAQKNTNKGNNSFVREQASIIQLNEPLENIVDHFNNEDYSEGRSHFYNMVHTELVFFHRTQAMEERLAPTYRRIDFLRGLIKIIEDQWIRIRTYFSIAPKFALFRGNKAARLFFNLLEANGQILALQNSIISRLDREHSMMKERYERLHFNAVQTGNEQEIEYFEDVNNEVQRSFEAYRGNISELKNAVHRLNEGISQLRDDFDSNTNIMLQLLIFSLSLVLVVWGVVTLGFEKGFDITGQKPLIISELLMIVGVCLLVLFGAFSMAAKYFVNRATQVMTKSSKRIITKSLENSKEDRESRMQVMGNVKGEVERHLNKLRKFQEGGHSLKPKMTSTYMYRINQLLELVIAILPAVSLRRLWTSEANRYLEETKDILDLNLDKEKINEDKIRKN